MASCSGQGIERARIRAGCSASRWARRRRTLAARCLRGSGDSWLTSGMVDLLVRPTDSDVARGYVASTVGRESRSEPLHELTPSLKPKRCYGKWAALGPTLITNRRTRSVSSAQCERAPRRSMSFTSISGTLRSFRAASLASLRLVRHCVLPP